MTVQRVEPEHNHPQVVPIPGGVVTLPPCPNDCPWRRWYLDSLFSSDAPPPHDGATGPYHCSCGWRGSMEQVMDHVVERQRAGDTRYYADGGHAVDLRGADDPGAADD